MFVVERLCFCRFIDFYVVVVFFIKKAYTSVTSGLARTESNYNLNLIAHLLILSGVVALYSFLGYTSDESDAQKI